MEIENKAYNQYADCVGKIICFDGANHWYNELKITSVDKADNNENQSLIEVSPVDATKDFNSINLDIDGSGDPVEDWIYVPDKPNAGIPIAVSHNAWAAGEQAVAIGRSAKAFGRDAKAIGNYATALGRATKAGYAAMAEGYGT